MRNCNDVVHFFGGCLAGFAGVKLDTLISKDEHQRESVHFERDAIFTDIMVYLCCGFIPLMNIFEQPRNWRNIKRLFFYTAGYAIVNITLRSDVTKMYESIEQKFNAELVFTAP